MPFNSLGSGKNPAKNPSETHESSPSAVEFIHLMTQMAIHNIAINIMQIIRWSTGAIQEVKSGAILLGGSKYATCQPYRLDHGGKSKWFGVGNAIRLEFYDFHDG